MARPALAPELHAVKGTQVEFRKRPTVSAVAEGSRPVCPRHVKGVARKAWNDVVRLLVRRKTLDEAAGPTLLIYATTMARFLEAKADVEKRGMMITVTKSTSKGDLYTTEIENPMLAIQVDAEAQLLQITKQLGIAPDAREKVLPVKPTARPGAEPAWMVAARAQLSQGKDNDNGQQ